MTQQYKIVFSDMDGTLLNSQHQISPRTKTAIQRLAQKGIPFIPVTARPPSAVTSHMAVLENRSPMICYSGALILGSDLQPLYSTTLSPDDLAQLAELIPTSSSLSVNHYSYADWFSRDVNNAWTKQEEAITELQSKPTPAELPITHKMLLIGEAEEIARLEPLLKAECPHLSIYRSKATYLEIMNKSATKSNAIRFLQRQLGIKTEDIMAFGDHFNDADMLEYVGLGVAMGNAIPEIKELADYTTLTNDEDGLAVVLERHFAK